MVRLWKNKKAQSTAEYAILIGLVVAAAMAMQTYVKRGIQARVHDESRKFYDELSADAQWGSITDVTADKLAAGQYEPETLSSQSTEEVSADTKTIDMDDTRAGSPLKREVKRETKQAAGDYQQQGY